MPRRELLERSNEIDAYERRIIAAWRQGFAAGHSAGWRNGYGQCDADSAQAWHEVAYPVAHPQRYMREVAQRGLRAAEAGCRRDADEHERNFVARAYATPPHLRNEVQNATVQLYPPPAALRRPARRNLRAVAGD